MDADAEAGAGGGEKLMWLRMCSGCGGRWVARGRVGGGWTRGVSVGREVDDGGTC